MSSENSNSNNNSNNVGNGPSTILSMPDDVESLKARLLEATAEVERLKPLEPLVESLNLNIFTLKRICKQHVKLIQEQQQQLEAQAASDFEEDTDEDDDEDDIVHETLERQTILSEKIFPMYALLSENKKKPGCVEDSLFDKIDPGVGDVMALLLEDPLRSALLCIDDRAYRETVDHMNNQLHRTTQKVNEFILKTDDLTEEVIPAASARVFRWEDYISKQEDELKELKGRLVDNRKQLADSKYQYKAVTREKEKLVTHRERMEKARHVTDVLKRTLETLSNFHVPTEANRMELPLGNVSSKDDNVFKRFKEKCGLTDYSSIHKKNQRELIAINRAAKMLGLEFSPYFRDNNLSTLLLGKGDKQEIAIQVCKTFQITIPPDADFKSPKRKRSSGWSPAMKKSKFNVDDTMDEIDAILASKERQEEVLNGREAPH